MELKFLCPNCGFDALEEIMSGAEVRTPVLALRSDGSGEFGPPAAALPPSGSLEYGCGRCGLPLMGADGPVSDREELVEWLIVHPPNMKRGNRRGRYEK